MLLVRDDQKLVFLSEEPVQRSDFSSWSRSEALYIMIKSVGRFHQNIDQITTRCILFLTLFGSVSIATVTSLQKLIMYSSGCFSTSYRTSADCRHFTTAGPHDDVTRHVSTTTVRYYNHTFTVRYKPGFIKTSVYQLISYYYYSSFI